MNKFKLTTLLKLIDRFDDIMDVIEIVQNILN